MPELIQIRDRIGTSYRDVGICLLNDEYGQVIATIVDDKKESKHILNEIFRQWINGKGKKCSRAGLIVCLKIAQLNVLAEALKSACVGVDKHTDRPTETFPHAEVVIEQPKLEKTSVIFSVITTLIIGLLLGFGCYRFYPGTEFQLHIFLVCMRYICNPQTSNFCVVCFRYGSGSVDEGRDFRCLTTVTKNWSNWLLPFQYCLLGSILTTSVRSA